MAASSSVISSAHLLMIAVIITLLVIFALVAGYYYNTKKWQELKISVKEDIKEISAGLKTTYENKSEFDVKQTKEANKVRDIETEILEDHDKRAKVLFKQIAIAQDVKDKDIRNIEEDIKEKNVQKDFASAQLINMKNSLDTMELNATILTNKIEALPVLQNVNQIEVLKERINVLANTSQDYQKTVSGIIDNVDSNRTTLSDIAQNVKTDYATKDDFDHFKFYMDGTFVSYNKGLSDLIPNDKLARDFVLSHKIESLSEDEKRNADTIKNMNLKKASLSNLVKEDDANESYRTLQMMEGYTKHSDAMSLVREKTFHSHHRILLNRIAALNKSLLMHPEIYSDRSKADKLFKEAELLGMAVSDAEARYRYITKNFVPKSRFDTANMEIRGMEAMAKDTLDNLNATMAGVKKTMDQVPNKYIAKANAKKTLTPMEETNKITNFVDSFPDQKMLSTIKTDSDLLYSKPQIFTNFQIALDNANTATLSLGTKRELADLVKMYDKKNAEKMAYIKAHEHDPITQKGEFSYAINAGRSAFDATVKNTPAETDPTIWTDTWVKNWPPNVPMTYWGTSWYRVNYPKPFSARPTNISVKCAAKPNFAISISHDDNPVGFFVTVQIHESDFGIASGNDLWYTDAGRAAVGAVQKFTWTATGPR